MQIYEPEEDSFLLEKYVKKYSKGVVLDLGTGSGIQAKTALKHAMFVVALDKNKDAVKVFSKSIKSDKLIVLTSDLFSCIKGKILEKGKLTESKNQLKFDTIIFNPPYLPNEPKDPDMALDGGKEGHELLGRFFSEVNNYLSENGVILIVFSSVTNKDKVIEYIENNGFKYNELEKKHVSYEDLFCFYIERK